jgi:hypothetical protein
MPAASRCHLTAKITLSLLGLRIDQAGIEPGAADTLPPLPVASILILRREGTIAAAPRWHVVRCNRTFAQV